MCYAGLRMFTHELRMSYALLRMFTHELRMQHLSYALV